MIKNLLGGIDGVAIYPIISLSIFFFFFVALAVFVWKADKGYIHHMEELPLGEEESRHS